MENPVSRNVALFVTGLALVAVGACASTNATEPAAPTVATEDSPASPSSQPELELPPGTITLRSGEPVEGAWDEGGPPAVLWETAGARILLRHTGCRDTDASTGAIEATTSARTQEVLSYTCDVARGGSRLGFRLGADGRVLVLSAVGAAGSDEGSASAFLIEWDPGVNRVAVAKRWSGSDVDAPPAWATLESR
jgi:hypothetical protein